MTDRHLSIVRYKVDIPRAKTVAELLKGQLIRRPKGKVLYRVTGQVQYNHWVREAVVARQVKSGVDYPFSLAEIRKMVLV